MPDGDFTLTVWQSGASLSARIECPAFLDETNDLIDLADVWPWAMQRTAQLDVFEGGRVSTETDPSERTCTCPALEIGLHGHRSACLLSRPECDCAPNTSGDHTEKCRQIGAMSDVAADMALEVDRLVAEAHRAEPGRIVAIGREIDALMAALRGIVNP